MKTVIPVLIVAALLGAGVYFWSGKNAGTNLPTPNAPGYPVKSTSPSSGGSTALPRATGSIDTAVSALLQDASADQSRFQQEEGSSATVGADSSAAGNFENAYDETKF